MKLQDSVKKETKNVFFGSLCLLIAMLLVFFVLSRLYREQIHFDYRVILGGCIGVLVATANFLLMGLMVQRVTETSDEELRRRFIRASYRNRMLLQILWMILCLVLPFIHPIAGILPLLFPSLVIKLRSVLSW